MSDRELRPLAADLVALLEDEKARPEPSRAVQHRLLSRLEASITTFSTVGDDDPGEGSEGGSGAAPAGSGAGPSGGAARGTTPAGGASSAGATGASATSVGAKILAHPVALAATTFALGGVLGVAASQANAREVGPRIVYVDRVVPAVSPAGPSESTSIPSIPASALPRAMPTPMTQAIHQKPPVAVTVPSSPDRDASLAAERGQLELAKTALGRRDYTSALEALAQHARQFPRGQLAEEREALAIQALVGAGHDKEAHARAERFRRDFSQSIFLPIVESAVR